MKLGIGIDFVFLCVEDGLLLVLGSKVTWFGWEIKLGLVSVGIEIDLVLVKGSNLT